MLFGRRRRLQHVLKNTDLFITTPTEKRKETPSSPVLIWVILSIILVSFLYWLFFYSPLFKVKNIILSQDIPQSLFFVLDEIKGENIFRLDVTQEREKLINVNPEIKEIKFVRGIPDTLKLQFEFRKKSVVWKSGDKFYLVDNEGIIFEEKDSTPEDEKGVILINDLRSVPINLHTKILTNDFLDFIEELYLKLPEQIKITPTSLEIDETTFQVSVLTDQNFKIKMDTTRKLQPQVDALKLVLEQHRQEVSEYIDVRVKGWAYFK